METIELDNLNKGELFEELKGKCKSRANITIGGILIVLLAGIWVMIDVWQKLDDTKDNISLILCISIGCLAVWSFLYFYQYKKKIGSLTTPDQLLYLFKKSNRVEIITASAVWVLIILETFVSGNIRTSILMLVAFVVVLVITIRRWGYWYRRGYEITEQLQELVDKK